MIKFWRNTSIIWYAENLQAIYKFSWECKILLLLINVGGAQHKCSAFNRIQFLFKFHNSGDSKWLSAVHINWFIAL